MTLLFHASDLHFGAQDSAALDWFMGEAMRARPDAIIITGDLTMRARRSEFRDACRWLQALPAPLSVEVGNHDLPLFDPVARMLHPYRRYLSLEAMIERPLALAEAVVVPLRTTARAQWRFDWSKGLVTRARVRHAVASLLSAKTTHRLIACHHPLIDVGTRSSGSTRGGAGALRALATAGATAILSGHVHDPFDMAQDIDGHVVRMIGAGTLSERVRATPPSYNAIRLKGQTMTVDSIRMG